MERHARHERSEFSTDGKHEKLAEAIFSESPKLYCWIVEVDNDVTGYCTFTIDFSSWSASHYLHLDCLYFDLPWRGKGLGKRLMEKLKSYATERQCANIQWQTPDFNVDAIRFYEKLGAESKSKVRFTWTV
jgi:GNAT superfamily N-acetyltransferase